jgi:integrase
VADVWKRKGRKTKPWVADYTDANGRRHRLSAETKEQAQILLGEKTREARAIGPTVQNPDVTLVEYAENTWLPLIKTSLKHATVKSYRYALHAHILPAFGNLKLRHLTRGHVKQFLTEKRQTGTLSKSTIRLIRAALSSMLGEAVDDGAAIINPALATGRTRGRKQPDTVIQTEVAPERPFNEAELSALLDAAPAQEPRVLLMLLARAGLRPGEAMGLQWTDLNFTKREILIERSFYDGVLGTTKTGRRRQVDMSQQLAAGLSSLYIQREREKLEGKWSEIPDWIFCLNNGEPLRIEHVRDRFDRALRRAGLSGHVPYDLRHTFASLLLAKAAPLTYVAKQMGHSNPGITLKHYAHWIPSGDKSFVDSLDEQPSPSESWHHFWHQSEKTSAFTRANRRIEP